MAWDGMGCPRWPTGYSLYRAMRGAMQLSNGNNGIVVRLMVSLGALSLSTQRLPTCYPVPTSKILGTIAAARWFWEERGGQFLIMEGGMTRDRRKQSCLRIITQAPLHISWMGNGARDFFNFYMRFNMRFSITSDIASSINRGHHYTHPWIRATVWSHANSAWYAVLYLVVGSTQVLCLNTQYLEVSRPPEIMDGERGNKKPHGIVDYSSPIASSPSEADHGGTNCWERWVVQHGLDCSTLQSLLQVVAVGACPCWQVTRTHYSTYCRLLCRHLSRPGTQARWQVLD